MKKTLIALCCIIGFCFLSYFAYMFYRNIGVSTFSSGYYDYSPNERYVVDVKLVEKRKWGKTIEEYYQVKAIVGKDYRNGKPFSVERISVEEAGKDVELDHDDVTWLIDENKVSVKVGLKQVDINLAYAPPNPRVIRTMRFEYISQLPEDLDTDGLNVKRQTITCDGTNEFVFTENNDSFFVRPEPGGTTELSYYLNPCYFFDFGKSLFDEVKASLSLRQLKQMKVHGDIALEDGHVYFFVGPKGYDDAPVPWKKRANCLLKVQFVEE